MMSTLILSFLAGKMVEFGISSSVVLNYSVHAKLFYDFPRYFVEFALLLIFQLFQFQFQSDFLIIAYNSAV